MWITGALCSTCCYSELVILLHLNGWETTAAAAALQFRKAIVVTTSSEVYVVLNVWCSVIFGTGAASKLNQNGVGGACNTLDRSKMHTKFWTENVKKTKTLRRPMGGWSDNAIRILIIRGKQWTLAHPAMNFRFSQTVRNFLPSRVQIVSLHEWLLPYWGSSFNNSKYPY